MQTQLLIEISMQKGYGLGEDNCPNCGGKGSFIVDSEGEACTKCGYVKNERPVDTGPEWRNSQLESGERDAARGGPPITITQKNMGMSTVIGIADRDAAGGKVDSAAAYRLRMWDSRSPVSASERNLGTALTEVDKITDKLGVSHHVKEEAAYVYRKALKNRLIRGRSIKGISAASVYAAIRKTETPRTIEDVAVAANMSKKSLARDYRILQKNLDTRMPLQSGSDLISRAVGRLGLSEKTARRAVLIVAEMRASPIGQGKNPKSWPGAAIYRASLDEGEYTTQKQVAEAIGVTEVTVRNRFKDVNNTIPLLYNQQLEKDRENARKKAVEKSLRRLEEDRKKEADRDAAIVLPKKKELEFRPIAVKARGKGETGSRVLIPRYTLNELKNMVLIVSERAGVRARASNLAIEMLKNEAIVQVGSHHRKGLGFAAALIRAAEGSVGERTTPTSLLVEASDVSKGTILKDAPLLHEIYKKRNPAEKRTLEYGADSGIEGLKERIRYVAGKIGVSEQTRELAITALNYREVLEKANNKNGNSIAGALIMVCQEALGGKYISTREMAEVVNASSTLLWLRHKELREIFERNKFLEKTKPVENQTDGIESAVHILAGEVGTSKKKMDLAVKMLNATVSTNILKEAIEKLAEKTGTPEKARNLAISMLANEELLEKAGRMRKSEAAAAALIGVAEKELYGRIMPWRTLAKAANVSIMTVMSKSSEFKNIYGHERTAEEAALVAAEKKSVEERINALKARDGRKVDVATLREMVLTLADRFGTSDRARGLATSMLDNDRMLEKAQNKTGMGNAAGMIVTAERIFGERNPSAKWMGKIAGVSGNTIISRSADFRKIYQEDGWVASTKQIHEMEVTPQKREEKAEQPAPKERSESNGASVSNDVRAAEYQERADILKNAVNDLTRVVGTSEKAKKIALEISGKENVLQSIHRLRSAHAIAAGMIRLAEELAGEKGTYFTKLAEAAGVNNLSVTKRYTTLKEAYEGKVTDQSAERKKDATTDARAKELKKMHREEPRKAIRILSDVEKIKEGIDETAITVSLPSELAESAKALVDKTDVSRMCAESESPLLMPKVAAFLVEAARGDSAYKDLPRHLSDYSIARASDLRPALEELRRNRKPEKVVLRSK